MESNAQRLLARLEPPRRDEVAAIADLEAVLAGQLAELARAWPTLAIDASLYLHALADKLRSRGDEPAAAVIRTMPAADLYLAAACTAGDSTAIAVFHEAIFPVVRAALGKLRMPDATIEEAEQRVLILVLVGDPHRPAIASYSGRGRLKSWVRSIGVRTGRRLAGQGAAAEGDLDELAASVRDPELALLRERYRDEVRAALGEALAGLPERQRTVLRQYYLDGLTIDQLAGLYRVDRATTARWVVAARTAVLGGTRTRLGAVLGATTTEVESILRLVGSELELSFRQL